MLVVGLGNPGRKYEGTRHNVGFRTVDILARMASIRIRKRLFRPYCIGIGKYSDTEICLAKPLTFMNGSGAIFPAIFTDTGETLKDLIIICDNLDLPPGVCRIKQKGSGAGQKGMLSSIEALGTDLFTRIFIGIGRPVDSNSVIDHVLGCPEPEESSKITEACERAAYGILHLPEWGINRVMNELNGRN